MSLVLKMQRDIRVNIIKMKFSARTFGYYILSLLTTDKQAILWKGSTDLGSPCLRAVAFRKEKFSTQ